jgi:glycosyltransferase involved in cell wall biosynthesis
MTSEKGHKWFIEAASRLEAGKTDRNLYYILVGDGPSRREYEEMVKARGLEKKFIFLGFRDDVPAILKNLDMLVVPSEEESFGNVVLEGMFAGIPVIASKVGGMKEIISDGIDGLYFESRDSEALAKCIKELVTDTNKQEQLAKGGSQKVISYFNMQRVADELEDVYENLIYNA